jgi:putative oxidoreductase
MSIFHWAVVVAGTLAEFILPLLIVIGLFTRLAAFGMIGFVIV